MARNCLRINHEGDSIQLSWQRGQSNPRPAPSVTFTHPFDEQALADLRWYLEEYLRFPYGLAPDNAAKVEQKFQDWGEQLFELVFRSSEQARQFFQAATYEGLNQCELVITSDSPEVLNLPWELLYSPSDRQFLAPSLAGMSRSLSDYTVRAEMGDLPQDKLNILLVIARPYGEKDIALRTIARPLLAAVANIRQKVNLKVLRPPSFEQFERELNANRGFYHIVHFDGHGDFDANSIGFQHTLGAAGQGLLVFEKNDGSPDIVTAAQIAQNLADCRVPIFVLNACKSAQEGEEKFSSVATRLVSLGAKGVVAMAYSVYAEAAKHFMGRLYGELAAGATLDSAVAAGRKNVLNKPQRPSPKGDKPLQDWLVPVLYQQESYTPFIPTTTDIDVLDIEDFLEPTVSNLVGFPEEGAYGFIGRDYDILRLERAFRQNNIVLLQGMAGVGKTELACGFARWLEETQGRTGKIFFMSFEQGATLSNVVNQVGREVWGDKFSQYRAEQQQQIVLNYLKTQPSLLIWDNFEPVGGFPAGNEPLLNATERDSLQRFLKELRGGKSWVLITSRREERWLDRIYTLLNLQGLQEQDVEELAAEILQRAGVDRAKLPPQYLDLLKLLGGHPLSLRVVLPHLKTQSPVQLIEALRQGLNTFQGAEEEGRDKSLTVSLDYSFAKLSEGARQHLPFLALFSERVNADFLHALSNSPDDNFGQGYRAVFGETLQKAHWLGLLNEAAEAGILEHLDLTIYKIHPALPWYLRQRLSEQHAAQEVSELEKKLLVFYAYFADKYYRELISNAELASFVLRIEEPNLLQNLRLAEQQQSWEYAQAILQALDEVYERIGRKLEFRALRQRALDQIGIYLSEAKAKGQDASNFWMYLRGVDANEALIVGDLEGARAIYQEILDELTSLDDTSVNDNIAVAYHLLGVVAQKQRHFEEAKAFYQQALQIYKDAEDWSKAATIYHQLGRVAEDQWYWDEAIAFYHNARKIFEDAGDWYSCAKVYYQLGNVAYLQQHWDEAKLFYYKSLKIKEDAGDWYSAANDYYQLGLVAQKKRRWDEAKDFYHKALKIKEDAGDTYNASYQYYGLGEIAKEQGDFDSAVAYFQKAFAARSAANDWYKAFLTIAVWGRTLETQEKWIEAVIIYIQALAISIKHHQEFVGVSVRNLGRMFKVMGKSQFEAVWQEVMGKECPEEIRSEIQAASEQNEE
ncbi:tetratricopeptide repeat protein [Microcoleus sp. FACHB-SPT15]|uniref:tetratricopeptide repeat protein n=1 Tax=Microcoleus sp. FACHB-SPT15 TaxID=2692830 RepID=UPI00177E23C4|nr:tetratricopeptide repeat protein [Microcoleus sp. FACHB-SPT15]MBD1808994.1 tetratricopeptide repeat protein [Microcoleus sp. FACHB-SPT15]